jgi:hypothetical protein
VATKAFDIAGYGKETRYWSIANGNYPGKVLHHQRTSAANAIAEGFS